MLFDLDIKGEMFDQEEKEKLEKLKFTFKRSRGVSGEKVWKKQGVSYVYIHRVGDLTRLVEEYGDVRVGDKTILIIGDERASGEKKTNKPNE